MASLTTARARLSPWLKLLSSNDHSVLLLCRSSLTTQLPKKPFHSILHPPRTCSQTVRLLPQTADQSRSCLFHQNRKWSSVPLIRVPQIDLDAETNTKPGFLKEGEEENAAEVLQNLGPEDARKLKIIKLEFDVNEQMNGMVPEVMTDENWLYVLRLENRSQRFRYYNFLRKKEMAKNARKKRKELKQQQRLEAPPEAHTPRPDNTIYFTVRDSAMAKKGNYRLAHAMQFGQPLVFDLDYEPFMRHQDCQNLVFQLMLSYGKNRDARDPFHFVFTSLDPQGKVFQMLRRANLVGSHFMGTMTDRSYLDVFPRERLVYLSPHAPDCLKEVNCDDVYIIGGLVDKTMPKPLSLARAKEQGIRVAKFPLDNYLLWGCGSKCLTVDQVTHIMLEQRRTKDWIQAFKAIPQRKLYREDVL